MCALALRRAATTCSGPLSLLRLFLKNNLENCADSVVSARSVFEKWGSTDALSNGCGVFWYPASMGWPGRHQGLMAGTLMLGGSLGPDWAKCFPALSRDVWEERGLAPIAGPSSLRFATGNWTRVRTYGAIRPSQQT